MIKNFKVGDKVVYGVGGISEIVDFTRERVGDVEKEYYVLSELGSSADSRTFVPACSERLTSLMRPIISMAEAEALLLKINEIPPLFWEKDSRKRAELFRTVLEEGNHERIVAMVKAIRINGEERAKEGKKNYLADENALRKAEYMLVSELSMALGRDITSNVIT